CRTRRALLHLSYSCAAPFGPADTRDTRPVAVISRVEIPQRSSAEVCYPIGRRRRPAPTSISGPSGLRLGDPMKRREFITLLGAAAAWPLAAHAQQPGKVYSIAFFTAGPFVALQAFVDGLQQLGWIEGKNVAFVYRSAENRLDRLQEIAV